MIMKTQMKTLQIGFEIIFTGTNLNGIVSLLQTLTKTEPKIETVTVELEQTRDYKNQTIRLLDFE